MWARLARAIIGVAVALAPVAAWAAEGGHGGEHHGPPWASLIWLAVDVFVLFLIVKTLVGKAIRDGLRAREVTLRDQIFAAEKAQKEAEGKMAEVEARLKAIDGEAETLRAGYRADAEKEAARIIENAEAAAAKLVADAEFTIDQAAKKAQRELRAEAVELAVRLAEDLIAKNITDQDRRALNQACVADLNKQKAA